MEVILWDLTHYLHFTDEETGPNKQSSFPETIQLVNSGAKIQTQDCLPPVPLTPAP